MHTSIVVEVENVESTLSEIDDRGGEVISAFSIPWTQQVMIISREKEIETEDDILSLLRKKE